MGGMCPNMIKPWQNSSFAFIRGNSSAWRSLSPSNQLQQWRSWREMSLQETAFNLTTNTTHWDQLETYAASLSSRLQSLFIKIIQIWTDVLKKKEKKEKVFSSWVNPHHSSSLLREAGCCPCRAQSSVAWSWHLLTSADECRCQCSAWGS